MWNSLINLLIYRYTVAYNYYHLWSLVNPFQYRNQRLRIASLFYELQKFFLGTLSNTFPKSRCVSKLNSAFLSTFCFRVNTSAVVVCPFLNTYCSSISVASVIGPSLRLEVFYRLSRLCASDWFPVLIEKTQKYI